MISKKIYFILVFITILLVASCKIETAKPPVNKELIILSDYLEESDTLLFESFIKEQQNLSLKIVNMQADKIIGLIRNGGFNVQADIIMVKNLSDVHKMKKSSLLQRINFINKLTPEQQKFSSQLYSFFGLGIDPFIVANSRKSNVRIYNDLLDAKFINKLNDKETVTMLSPIVNKLKKVEANLWVKNFVDSSLSISFLKDSTYKELPILTLYSDFSTNKDSLLDYSSRFLCYPNSKSTGTFFNLRTITIINQAQNYLTAKEFIFYCLEEKNNRRINNYLNTFSISSQNKVFRRYNVSQEKLVEYHQIIGRILRKLK